jgi:uncharacterized protein
LDNHQLSQLIAIQDDGRIFTDMPDDQDLNPCLSCGACCAYFRVSFYAGEVDCHPGGTVPDALVLPINAVMVCMKNTEQGGQSCIALRGTPGKPGISCAIYTHRPSPCREFLAWNPDGTPNSACHRLRMKWGLPTLQPLLNKV